MDCTEYLLELTVRLREVTLTRGRVLLTMLNRERHEVVSDWPVKQALSQSERNGLAVLKPVHQSWLVSADSERASRDR